MPSQPSAADSSYRRTELEINILAATSWQDDSHYEGFFIKSASQHESSAVIVQYLVLHYMNAVLHLM